jgi:hypothetical protein
MRTPALGLSVALLLPATGWAQQDQSVPDFNSIRTPTSPAFVLLGVEPTSVARPNTPADFAASVLTGTQNLSSLPRDYALEVSPYWMVGHPTMRWTRDTTRTILESLARTFTVSVATAEIGTESSPLTGLALGTRASLLSGRTPAAQIARIEELEARLAADAARIDSLTKALNDSLDAAQQLALAAAKTPEEMNRVLADFTAIRANLTRPILESAMTEEEDQAIQKEFEDIAGTREGLFIEVAGGAAWAAPNAVLDSAQTSSWGAWLTASYTLPRVSFVGVVRYQGLENAGTTDAIDFGGRMIYTRASYGLSVEYVGRHITSGTSRPDLWRLAGVIDYRVSPAFWLTGSFGRNYSGTAPGSLMARIGLSLNLSAERYQNLTDAGGQ